MSAADRTEPQTDDERTDPDHDPGQTPDPERPTAQTPAPGPADEADDDEGDEEEGEARTGWPVGQILLGVASVLTLGGLGLYQLAGWPGVAAGAAVPAAGGAAVARRWRDRHLPRAAPGSDGSRHRTSGDGVLGGVLGGGSGPTRKAGRGTGRGSGGGRSGGGGMKMPSLPTLGTSGRGSGRGTGRGRASTGTGGGRGGAGGGRGRGGAGLKMPSLGGGGPGRARGRSGGMKIPSLGGGRTAGARSGGTGGGNGAGRGRGNGTPGARTRTSGTRPSTTRAGTASPGTGPATAGGGPSRRTGPGRVRRVMGWANDRTGGRAGRALNRVGRWADNRTGGRASRAARAAGRAVNHATTPQRPPRWVAMAAGATFVLTGAMSPWLAVILGGAGAAGGLTYWAIRRRRGRRADTDAAKTEQTKTAEETGEVKTGGAGKTDPTPEGPKVATPGATPHAGGTGDHNRAGASPDPTVGPGGIRFQAAIPGYTPTTGRSSSMASRLPMVPLAIDMHGAMAKYLPQNMWEVAADLEDLHTVPDYVATALRAYANTLMARYPIRSEVITEMGQMYKVLVQLSGQATQMSAMFNKIHEIDIQRRVAPRVGEEKWDVKG